MRVEETIFRYRKVTAKILSITRGAKVVGRRVGDRLETRHLSRNSILLNAKNDLGLPDSFEYGNILSRLHKRRGIS